MKQATPIDARRVEELTRDLTQELERASSAPTGEESASAERSRACRTEAFRASGAKHAIM
jgi:hypothetical protein